MKEKFSKRILSLFIAVVFCLTTFAMTGFSVDKAYAEEYEYEFPDTTYVVLYPKDASRSKTWLPDDWWVDIDMETVTYSKEGIAELVKNAYIDEDDGTVEYYYHLQGLKVGTTVLTFQVRLGEGPWEEKIMTVNVVKYVNPFKTLKVGKKSYVKKFNSKVEYKTSKKVSGKLVITPKKGWQLIELRKYIHKKSQYINIKNKKKVKLAKKDDLQIRLWKKGTDIVITYTLTRK